MHTWQGPSPEGRPGWLCEGAVAAIVDLLGAKFRLVAGAMVEDGGAMTWRVSKDSIQPGGWGGSELTAEQWGLFEQTNKESVNDRNKWHASA